MSQRREIHFLHSPLYSPLEPLDNNVALPTPGFQPRETPAQPLAYRI